MTLVVVCAVAPILTEKRITERIRIILFLNEREVVVILFLCLNFFNFQKTSAPTTPINNSGNSMELSYGFRLKLIFTGFG